MSISESVIEDVALGWFRELGNDVIHSRDNANDRPAAERDSFGEVAFVGRLCEALWTLNPVSFQSRTLATLRDTLLSKLLSGEPSVSNLELGKGKDNPQ